MSNDKSPFRAGVLSLFLPGLGLLYLGLKRAALINFALVNIAMILLVVVWGEPTLVEHVHYLFLGFAALSAGYAHGVAASKLRKEQDVSNGTSHGAPA